MDRLTVLHLPNDERIVLTDAGKELVIWAELQFQNLLLNSTKDSHRSASLHVPKDNGRIRDSLEDSAFLASGDYVAGVRDSERADLHVVPAQELLIVLVHEVLDDEQAADVVKQSVLHSWVEFDCICVAAIVAERMVHLEHLLLAFSCSWLFHGCHVAWCLIPFLRAEDARLQVLLSVHFFKIIVN